MCSKDPRKVCSGTCHPDTSTKPVRLVFDNVQWLKATSYADLLSMLQQYNGQKVKLLGANTGTGKLKYNYIITDRFKAVVLMWSLLAVLVSEFR